MQAQGLVCFGKLQQSLGKGWQLQTNQFQAQLHGKLPSLLLVDGANLDPLVVTEQRQVDRSGHMTLFKLPWAAHVHDRPLGRQECIDFLGRAGARHHC